MSFAWKWSSEHERREYPIDEEKVSQSKGRRREAGRLLRKYASHVKLGKCLNELDIPAPRTKIKRVQAVLKHSGMNYSDILNDLLTLKELKQACRDGGVSSSGSKDNLISRLLE
jgi:hypothetical protein